MMKNIVVIRAGALGDIILALPAIQALRLRYPDASLRVVGYPALWQVAGSLIDKVTSIDAPMFAGLFTGVPSDQLYSWLRGVDLVVAWTARDPRPALEDCRVPHIIYVSPYPPPGVHVSDWLMDSVEEWRESNGDPTGKAVHGGTDPTNGLVRHESTRLANELGTVHRGVEPSRSLLSLAPEEMARGREILMAMGLNHPIAIHPGAGAPWKRWPAKRFAELAQEIAGRGHQVVLIEGPADGAVVAEVRQRMEGEIPVLRDLPLRVLGAALAQCALFIGNDSGVTHLAAAAGAAVLALFGPTDPASWVPRGRDTDIVLILRACPLRAERQGQVRVCDDPACMAGIDVSEALQGFETLLANVQNSVENPQYSVDNVVDPPSSDRADSRHHHFDTPSSRGMPRP